MHIQRLGKLIMQVLGLLLSFQQLFLKHENLAFQVWYALSLHLSIVQFTLRDPEQIHESYNVIDLLLIVIFTLLKS